MNMEVVEFRRHEQQSLSPLHNVYCSYTLKKYSQALSLKVDSFKFKGNYSTLQQLLIHRYLLVASFFF